MHMTEPGSKHTPEQTRGQESLYFGPMGSSAMALTSDDSGPSKQRLLDPFLCPNCGYIVGACWGPF